MSWRDAMISKCSRRSSSNACSSSSSRATISSSLSMAKAKSMVKIAPRQTTQQTATNRAYLASRRAPSVRGGGADLTARSGRRWRRGGGGTTGGSPSRDNGATRSTDQTPKRPGNPAAAVGWEAREGRSDEKRGANQRFMQIVADMWEPASLFVVSGVPVRPVGRDGSGRRTPYRAAPDKNGLWGTRLKRFFCPARPKSLWGTLWGTGLEML
ncbi:hypothetical protein QYE76_071435 [Lolium multiflorum]|uniref:Uncharacterized protein n=1 Tax=Lolium multiflorum TaxID=4521 RepID=A0AAD8WFE4_LOLMU|nr:hypothetical protein QYE76_071435 [Lolium multiflorum]